MRKEFDTTNWDEDTLSETKPLYKARPQRIHGLDFLRGICVILMMFDHLAFDFAWLPEWSWNFYRVDNAALTALRMVLRLSVISLFFILSGISSSFSHNNVLRGGKLAIASATLSLFTFSADRLFDLGLSIAFGVLHCLTVAILIFAVLQILLKDKAKYACLGLGVLFFIWGLRLDFYQTDRSNNLTNVDLGVFEYLQLTIGAKYYGADSFGILPYGGIFLIGAYGGAVLYTEKRPYLPLFGKRGFRPVCFVGRKAVWFYLLHQLVLFGAVAGIGYLCGLRYF